MDALEMLLIRRERMRSHLERLTEDLSEEEIRRSAHPTMNPLAWLLWHVARAEDGAVNLLIFGGSEVLDDGWRSCLGVDRRDAGTGMTMEEAVDLSSRLHLPSVMAYGRAVGERTAELIASLSPADLDEAVSPARVRRAATRLAAAPARADLERVWLDVTIGDLLAWLALTHTYEHIGQADLIRGLLGRSGRF